MSEQRLDAKKPDPHEPERSHTKTGFVWFTWAMLTLGVYVFSVGPAVKFMPSSDKAAAVVEFVYAPLLRYGVTLKPVHDFLRWYIEDLWHCKGCVGTLALAFPPNCSRPFAFIPG